VPWIFLTLKIREHQNRECSKGNVRSLCRTSLKKPRGWEQSPSLHKRLTLEHSAPALGSWHRRIDSEIIPFSSVISCCIRPTLWRDFPAHQIMVCSMKLTCPSELEWGEALLRRPGFSAAYRFGSWSAEAWPDADRRRLSSTSSITAVMGPWGLALGTAGGPCLRPVSFWGRGCIRMQHTHAARMCHISNIPSPCTLKLLAASPAQHYCSVTKALTPPASGGGRNTLVAGLSVTEHLLSGVSPDSWLSGSWSHLKVSTGSTEAKGPLKEGRPGKKSIPPP
jgi:hypothetical protein